MKIGTILKEQRKLKNLTIKDLSNATGISRSYISYIEHDKREPNFEVINKICNVLGLPLELILLKSVEIDKIKNKHLKEFYREVLPLVDDITKRLF